MNSPDEESDLGIFDADLASCVLLAWVSSYPNCVRLVNGVSRNR